MGRGGAYHGPPEGARHKIAGVETVQRRLGLGAGVSGPNTGAIARALDAQLDAIEQVWIDFVEELTRLDPASDVPPSRAALRALGLALGVAEDAGWTDEDFRFALLARADSRASSGTAPDLIRFAQNRSPLGDGTADGQPVWVGLYIAGGLSLTAHQQDATVAEALRAIPADAGLSIAASTIEDASGILTLDIGPGLDIGMLAGSLYP